jgi:hypothetical protein
MYVLVVGCCHVCKLDVRCGHGDFCIMHVHVHVYGVPRHRHVLLGVAAVAAAWRSRGILLSKLHLLCCA